MVSQEKRSCRRWTVVCCPPEGSWLLTLALCENLRIRLPAALRHLHLRLSIAAALDCCGDGCRDALFPPEESDNARYMLLDYNEVIIATGSLGRGQHAHAAGRGAQIVFRVVQGACASPHKQGNFQVPLLYVGCTFSPLFFGCACTQHRKHLLEVTNEVTGNTILG